MNLDAYLNRISYQGPVAANLATLRALHRSHLLAIPYENLDVQWRERVPIEVPLVFRKIVTCRRGGWCYEMNGLFGWALHQLGFQVTRSAGAVMRAVSGDSAVGNHLVLKVSLEEGVFLADVGFGDGPLDPILVAPGAFTSHGFHFGLTKEAGNWWRMHNHDGGGAASFDFDLAPADEALLAAKCDWLQSAPESMFVQNAVCQRHTPSGLAILRGRVLRHLTPDVRSERLISDATEYVAILGEVFGLDVPQAAALWPRICARHDTLFAKQDDATT